MIALKLRAEQRGVSVDEQRAHEAVLAYVQQPHARESTCAGMLKRAAAYGAADPALAVTETVLTFARRGCGYGFGDIANGDDENFWSMGPTGPCPSSLKSARGGGRTHKTFVGRF